MRTKLKPYIRPFLFTGLTFGILFGLSEYYGKGKIDFVRLIIMMILFGALMSWNKVTLQKRKQKEKNTTNLTDI